ncbi:MAG: hypothetical protein Q7T46_10120 [Polaromonas sp.]|jgi:hypothetical protein|nr:hypothetical protein [Polaromonas sp.]
MVFGRMAKRAAGGYLALVLLLAPMLGLMHGLVHGAGDDRQAAHTHLADGHAHEHGWLDDLFSAHGDASDCRVFDQLSHGDVLPALPLLALPMVLSSFVFHFSEGEVLARRAALFEARGPPLVR